MEKTEEQKEQTIMIEQNEDRGIIIVQNENEESNEGEPTLILQIDGAVVIQEKQMNPSVNSQDNDQIAE